MTCKIKVKAFLITSADNKPVGLVAFPKDYEKDSVNLLSTDYNPEDKTTFVSGIDIEIDLKTAQRIGLA